MTDEWFDIQKKRRLLDDLAYELLNSFSGTHLDIVSNVDNMFEKISEIKKRRDEIRYLEDS